MRIYAYAFDNSAIAFFKENKPINLIKTYPLDLNV